MAASTVAGVIANTALEAAPWMNSRRLKLKPFASAIGFFLRLSLLVAMK
jgi:hypothetical protein